jgi:hypothetical protein
MKIKKMKVDIANSKLNYKIKTGKLKSEMSDYVIQAFLESFKDYSVYIKDKGSSKWFNSRMKLFSKKMEGYKVK